jgi:hypothetical protein
MLSPRSSGTAGCARPAPTRSEPAYWVVTQEAIYEHTGPISTGYRKRVEFPRGERIPVPYASSDLAVHDLIAPSGT